MSAGPVTYTSAVWEVADSPGPAPPSRTPYVESVAEGYPGGALVLSGPLDGGVGGVALFPGDPNDPLALRYGAGFPASRVNLPTHGPVGILSEAQRILVVLWSRWLVSRNMLATGFRDRIRDFVGSVQTQFVLKGQSPGAASSGPADADSTDGPAAPPEVGAATQLWEECCYANDWGHGAEDREREARERLVEDGEVIIRIGPGGADRDYLPWFRFVEPEQVRPPGGPVELPPGIDPDDVDCTWGVFVSRRDAEHRYGYWVVAADGSGRGEFVPADEVVFLKSNVKRCERRGIPDFFPVEQSLQDVLGTLMNMGGVAKVVSRTAYREKHAGGAEATRALLSQASEAYARYSPGGSPGTTAAASHGFPIRDHAGVQVVHVEASREFEEGPTASAAPNLIAVSEEIVKAVCFRFGLPDWAALGSADTFASSLVSGSPFVRSIEDRQDRVKGFTRELACKALALAERSGRLPPGTAAAVRPICTAKPVVIADEEKQARVFETELRNKVLSPQEWIKKRGRDPKVVAAELADWAEKFPQPDQSGDDQGFETRSFRDSLGRVSVRRVRRGSADPTPAPPGSAGGDGSSPNDPVAESGPPGSPPRPGLVWNDTTHRWRNPETGEEHDHPGGGPAAPVMRRDTRNSFVAEFSHGGVGYTVHAHRDGEEVEEKGDRAPWSVEFISKAGGGPAADHGATGTAGHSAVGAMRTMARALSDWMAAEGPQRVVFLADRGEPARVKLYERLAAGLAAAHGYDVSRTDGANVRFLLTKRPTPVAESGPPARFTGRRTDSLGRNRCYSDGKPVPCHSLGGDHAAAGKREAVRQSLADPAKLHPHQIADLNEHLKTLTAQELRAMQKEFLGKFGSQVKPERVKALLEYARGKAAGAAPAAGPAPPEPAAKEPPAKKSKPEKPAAGSPPAVTGAVPAGHTLAAADKARGILVSKDKGGELTTRFAPGAPEKAAGRLGKAIGEAMAELRLDVDNQDGLIPLGQIAHEVRRAVPDATDGEVMAALSHLRSTRQLEGQALNEVRALTDPKSGVSPLGDGKDPATATLWDNGRALHYWMSPRGPAAGTPPVAAQTPRAPDAAAESLKRLADLAVADVQRGNGKTGAAAGPGEYDPKGLEGALAEAGRLPAKDLAAVVVRLHGLDPASDQAVRIGRKPKAEVLKMLHDATIGRVAMAARGMM